MWECKQKRVDRAHLLHSSLNDGMDGESRVGDLDVLLKMEKGELEFGEFLLGHWDT